MVDMTTHRATLQKTAWGHTEGLLTATFEEVLRRVARDHWYYGPDTTDD